MKPVELSQCQALLQWRGGALSLRGYRYQDPGVVADGNISCTGNISPQDIFAGICIGRTSHWCREAANPSPPWWALLVWQERETSHESWGQKCCLAQAWTQSAATELAPASCLILWQYRKTLVLLYEPQLTLLILSHLLCETTSTETSQVLNINQEKKCNAVFPGLGKQVQKQGIWGIRKWRWCPPASIWISHHS